MAANLTNAVHEIAELSLAVSELSNSTQTPPPHKRGEPREDPDGFPLGIVVAAAVISVIVGILFGALGVPKLRAVCFENASLMWQKFCVGSRPYQRSADDAEMRPVASGAG